MPPNGCVRSGVNRTIRRAVAHFRVRSGTLCDVRDGGNRFDPLVVRQKYSYIGATAPHDPPADPPTAGFRSPRPTSPQRPGVSLPPDDPARCRFAGSSRVLSGGQAPRPPAGRDCVPPDPPLRARFASPLGSLRIVLVRLASPRLGSPWLALARLALARFASFASLCRLGVTLPRMYLCVGSSWGRGRCWACCWAGG